MQHDALASTHWFERRGSLRTYEASTPVRVGVICSAGEGRLSRSPWYPGGLGVMPLWWRWCWDDGGRDDGRKLWWWRGRGVKCKVDLCLQEALTTAVCHCTSLWRDRCGLRSTSNEAWRKKNAVNLIRYNETTVKRLHEEKMTAILFFSLSVHSFLYSTLLFVSLSLFDGKGVLEGNELMVPR